MFLHVIQCDKILNLKLFQGGINNLEMFINKKIRFFESDRNDPTKNGLSNMSPW